MDVSRRARRRKYGIIAGNRRDRNVPMVAGYCPPPCGKQRYISRRAAKAGLRAQRGQGRDIGDLREYRCVVESQYWHLGGGGAREAEFVREQNARRNGGEQS